MVTQELEHAIISEREREANRVQLERQAKTGISATRAEIHFLTTAARVLAAVTREPGATMRDLARRCGKTERAIWQQLQDLERAGLLSRRRVGRRSRYVVDLSAVERQLLMESAPLLA